MSAARTNKHVSLLSIVIPSIAILAFGGGIAGQLGLFETGRPGPNIEQPETVCLHLSGRWGILQERVCG